MDVINLTAERVVMLDEYVYRPSGVQAELVENYTAIIDGLCAVKSTVVSNLPSPKLGFLYLVDPDVAYYLRRKDLVVPAVNHADSYMHEDGTVRHACLLHVI